MKNIFITTFIVLSCFLYSNESIAKINYDYINMKYTVEYEFISDCDAEELLNILYNYNHIKKYFDHFKEIKIINSGNDWYDAVYYFEAGFFSFTSTYKRIINKNDKIVYYYLLDYKKNSPIFPTVIKSTGYYKIEKIEENKNKVIYFQETYLDKMGKVIFRSIHKSKTKRFFKVLRKYINESNIKQKKQ